MLGRSNVAALNIRSSGANEHCWSADASFWLKARPLNTTDAF